MLSLLFVLSINTAFAMKLVSTLGYRTQYQTMRFSKIIYAYQQYIDQNNISDSLIFCLLNQEFAARFQDRKSRYNQSQIQVRTIERPFDICDATWRCTKGKSCSIFNKEGEKLTLNPTYPKWWQ